MYSRDLEKKMKLFRNEIYRIFQNISIYKDSSIACVLILKHSQLEYRNKVISRNLFIMSSQYTYLQRHIQGHLLENIVVSKLREIPEIYFNILENSNCLSG
ncbi:MAG: hypothetical protein MHMPM18_003973 [Marteilia pararefringens]